MGVGPSASVIHPSALPPPVQNFSATQVQSTFSKFKTPDCVHYTHRSNRVEIEAPAWTVVQEKYNLFLRSTREHDEFDVDPVTKEWPAPHRHTLKVKYKVDFEPQEGHTVRASERIPKGTLVYSDEDKGVFRSEEEFHQFLSILNDERLACYIVVVFGDTMEDGTNSSVTSPLDESALVVGGRFKSDGSIGFISNVTNDQCITTTEYYALRDIEVGEELAISHSVFDARGGEDEDEDDLHWFNEISCEGEKTSTDCWYTAISLDQYEEDYYAKRNWTEDPVWIVGKEFRNFKLPECDKILASPKSIFTQELWDKYQEKYSMFVRSTRPYNEAEADPVTKEWPQKLKKSFEIKYEIELSPGKGRGVFSKENITEGSLVYKHRSLLFRTDDEFLQYLSLLSDEMACDVMEWSTVLQQLDGTYALSFEAHDAALLNSPDVLGENNMGLPNNRNGDTTYLLFERVATFDIREGDELLDDYTLYIEDDIRLAWFLPIKRAFYGISENDDDNDDNEDDDEDDNEDINDKVDKDGVVNTNITGLLVDTKDCTNTFTGESNNIPE
eukprot:scaffold14442_cov46-Attheya_sp.AAC.3